MRDDPEYEISEFLLAGLLISCALASLVGAAANLLNHEFASFSKACGLSLMFLGGCTHPKRYIIDCLTFPFTLMGRSGRETPITAVGSGLGFTLWLAGLLANHFVT